MVGRSRWKDACISGHGTLPNASTIAPPTPPLRSTTASSPFQLATAELTRSVTARIDALASPCATTNTSPAVRVPDSTTDWLNVVDPLLYSSSRYPPAVRSTGDPVPL